jgi:hypothetical protein
MQRIYHFCKAVDIQQRKPLTVSMIERTRFGKLSLINALYRASLPPNLVRLGTTKIRKCAPYNKDNGQIFLCTLLGRGETT